MTGACSGIRVLDLSREPAGAMATMVLADFGADVVRIDTEGGATPTDPTGVFLHRGKRRLDHDLGGATAADDILALAREVDVVVESLGAGRADALGIGYEQLKEANPGLVYCSISGYGPTGPLADARFDDGLVMATAGIFRDQQGWLHDGRRRPVFRSARDASYLAGMLALQGVLAALRARALTGRGQLVETSLLQGLTHRLNPMVRWVLRDGEDPPLGNGYTGETPAPVDPKAPRGAELVGMAAECKDGRRIIHMLFERNFFPSWVSVLGMEWIWDDERFKGAPRSLDPDARDELAELLAARMKEKTAAEWMELYVENGNVCADVVETTQEALHHPQVVAGDFLIELDDPELGRVVEIGPLTKIRDADVVEAAPGESAKRGGLDAGPLDGVVVVEVASHYATPTATAQLADLGARVIKVEPVTGDAYRHAVQGMGHDNLVRAVQGKQNIAVDLKDPRGQEIVHRLVARADVFIHNFRLGVPERLGIDPATLHALNPRLVYQYGASYGSTGPYRRQPAIDHVIAAFAGTTAYQAGEGNPPLKEQGADPTAAAGAAASMLLGLAERDRTGRGQYVESAMIVSNLYLNHADAFEYDGKRPRPAVDHDQLGTGATYRLYETAPVEPGFRAEPWENADPHWVFLSAESDDDFVRFCAVARRDDLAADARFASADARREHREELERLLEPVLLTRPAHAWEADLRAAGVGCAVADAMSFFAFVHRHPQARALGMMVPTEHPTLGGVYLRHAPAVRHAETPGTAGPYCETGEHTQEILRELGYDDDEVAALRDAGVITWPAQLVERGALV
jgi:crotonobetainyl-CoA:carnitine CoA-transferase CaiB-like acyl-CoA transferase